MTVTNTKFNNCKSFLLWRTACNRRGWLQ